jgi:hypothetical protein
LQQSPPMRFQDTNNLTLRGLTNAMGRE